MLQQILLVWRSTPRHSAKDPALLVELIAPVPTSSGTTVVVAMTRSGCEIEGRRFAGGRGTREGQGAERLVPVRAVARSRRSRRRETSALDRLEQDRPCAIDALAVSRLSRPSAIPSSDLGVLADRFAMKSCAWRSRESAVCRSGQHTARSRLHVQWARRNSLSGSLVVERRDDRDDAPRGPSASRNRSARRPSGCRRSRCESSTRWSTCSGQSWWRCRLEPRRPGDDLRVPAARWWIDKVCSSVCGSHVTKTILEPA